MRVKVKVSQCHPMSNIKVKVKCRQLTQIDRDYIGSLGRDPVTLMVKVKVVLCQISWSRSSSRSPKVKYGQKNAKSSYLLRKFVTRPFVDRFDSGLVRSNRHDVRRTTERRRRRDSDHAKCGGVFRGV